LVDITTFEDLENIPNSDQLCGHTEVPILTDGDIVVFEAPAILDYLAKRYTDHTGFGKTLQTRTICSSMLSWTNSDLHRIAGFMYAYPQFLDRYRLETESANECLIESGIQALTAQLSKIENRYLKRSEYLCGSELSVADSFMVTTLMQSQWGGFNFAMWPKVRAWMLKVMDQPHWQTVHEAHMEFIHEMLAEQEA